MCAAVIDVSKDCKVHINKQEFIDVHKMACKSAAFFVEYGTGARCV